MASEAANPELRGVLAAGVKSGGDYCCSVGSGVANREPGIGDQAGEGAENREQPVENSYSLLPTTYSPERSDPVCETPHFAVYALDGVIVVLHRLELAEIDNDIAELVAGELIRPGHVPVTRAFERCFAGVVLSSSPGPREAWRAFYNNTLSKLERVVAGSYPAPGSGPVAVFGRIYQHARALVAGSSLLDVGTCFGFFPLLLQRSEMQIDIVALDVSAPILELVRDAAGSRRHAETVTFVCGDACSLPFANRSFDTVSALHVLEHLAPSSASWALQEMCRVARRRVIVAVPMEEEADPAYDHLQRFDREGLIDLGEKTGWRCGFEDYLGGWIVLEPHE